MENENNVVEQPVVENTEVSNESEANEAEENQEAQSEAVEAKAEAPKVEAKKEEAKRNLKKLKFKIDGKEEEEEIDLDNEQELTRRLQLGKAAQKRMQEAAEDRKNIEQIFKIMQSDPALVMKQLGLDPEEFAVKYLQGKIEEQQKSPEQREIERLQKELEDIRKLKEYEEQRMKQEQLQRFEAQYAQNLEQGMIKALETANLPKKPYIVKKFADHMLAALEHGIELSPEELIPVLQKELKEDIRDMFSATPDEIIQELIGKDRFNSMRKKQIAAVKKTVESANQIKQTGDSVKAKGDDSKGKAEKLSMSDFLRS